MRFGGQKSFRIDDDVKAWPSAVTPVKCTMSLEETNWLLL